MKSKTIVCIACAASLGVGALAFAQEGRYDRHDGGDRHEQRGDRHEQRGDRHDWREHDRGEAHGDAYSYGARGPQWRRGGRIPDEYRNRQYVVRVWRDHHLLAPPRGYQWGQVGGDYVLVAVASGVIAQLILNGS